MPADDDRTTGGRGRLALWRASEWARRALARFTAARAPRQSAAIAYYVLLSLFPLILVLASIAGFVLTDDELRQDFAEAIAEALPLTETGAADVESALRGVSSSAGAVGAVSLLTLLWTASSMMGAVRGSLDDLDPDTPARPFAHGKLIDLIMLVVALLLLAASAGLTVATRIAGADAGRLVGVTGLLYEFARVLVPIALGTLLLIVLLRWVPTAGARARDTWPACLVGAAALWGLSTGFAWFVSAFGRYNLVYGSLATVVVFLVFVYLAANIVLMTAAFAAEWRDVRHERPEPAATPGPGLGEQVWQLVRGLFVRDDGRPPTP